MVNELSIDSNRGFSKELLKFTKQKVKIELMQNHNHLNYALKEICEDMKASEGGVWLSILKPEFSGSYVFFTNGEKCLKMKF